MASIETTTSLNGGSITVHIYEDIDGDGAGPNSVTTRSGATVNYENHDSASLSGGTETTQFSGLQDGVGHDYYVRFEIDTATPESDSPTIDSHTLNVPTASASGLGTLTGSATPTVDTVTVFVTADGDGFGGGSATLVVRGERKPIIGTLDNQDENDMFMGSNI